MDRCRPKRCPIVLLSIATILVAGLTAQAAGQDFSETRLREGEQTRRARRPVEAIDQLRIVAFGLLDRPALLCEALVYLALAEEAAGRHIDAQAVVERLSEIERQLPACATAKLDQAVRTEFESRFRRRRPASALATATPSEAPPKPAPSPEPQVADGRAASALATATPSEAPPKPAPSPEPQVADGRPASALATATPSEAPPKPAPSPEPQVADVSPQTAGQSEAEEVGADAGTPPRVKRSVQPIYPPAARRGSVRGTVILRALISEAGLPLEIRVARGVRQDLDEAAVTALQKWTFEPGRRNGREVRAWATIQVSFQP